MFEFDTVIFTFKKGHFILYSEKTDFALKKKGEGVLLGLKNSGFD